MENGRGRAPGFENGHGWLNALRPITKDDLKGKIVLLDFWTYCCINCLHILPALERLEAKYAAQLVVIGVHCAKYRNERHNENIRQAILRLSINHPVVNDRDFRIWRRYGVNAWPTLVLLDEQGSIIGKVSGEGDFEALDEAISGAIELARRRGTLKEGAFPLKAPESPPRGSSLLFPGKVLADAASNRLFIADTNHNRILIAEQSGQVLFIAGGSEPGWQDGAFEKALFRSPQGMALKDDFLFVADTGNHLVRRLDLKEKSVETVAGSGKQAGWGSKGGASLRSDLNSPWDLAFLGKDLFIAMAGSHQVWKRDPSGWLGPFAGSGQEDLRDGSPSRAALAQPSGICTDEGNFLFVADSETSSVRRIDARTGTTETLVGEGLFTFGDADGTGNAVRLQHPLGVALHRKKILLADTYNHKIKTLDPVEHRVRTLFGKGSPGFEDGTDPAFYEPGGLSIAGDRLFIADTNNHSIRFADLSGENPAVETLALKI